MLAPYFAKHYPWLGPYIDANFNTLAAIYLIIGFIMDIIMLKFEESESPVGSLLMVTFCWGLGLLLAPFPLELGDSALHVGIVEHGRALGILAGLFSG